MAYWCDKRLTVTLKGPAGTTVLSLDRPYARIGSDPGSDVVLPGEDAPRRFAYLHATEEGVYCLFLRKHGDHEEGTGKWLGPNEELTIGELRLTAAVEGDDLSLGTNAGDLLEWGETQPPWPLFSIPYKGKLLARRRFHARLNLIGRRPDCVLQLKAERVSAHHCALYWTGKRLWCIDLLSSNGTFLNGNLIRCAEVETGAHLTVGEFELVYERASTGRADPNPGPITRSVTKIRKQPATGENPDQGASGVGRPQAGPEDLRPLATLAALDAPHDPDALLFDVGESGVTVGQQNALAGLEQLAQDKAALIAEREAWQQAQRAAEHALAAAKSELEVQAAEIARQQTAFEQLRALWDQQRSERETVRGAHQTELESRANQLSQVEAELSAARQDFEAKLAEMKSAAVANSEALAKSQQDWQSERAAHAAELEQHREQLRQRDAELAAAQQHFDAELAEVKASVVIPFEPSEPQPSDEVVPADHAALLEEIGLLRAQLDEREAELNGARQRQEAQFADLSARLADMAATSAAASEELTRAQSGWKAERAALSTEIQLQHEQLQQKEKELVAAREQFNSDMAAAQQRFDTELAELKADVLVPVEPIESPPEEDTTAREHAARLQELELRSARLDEREAEMNAARQQLEARYAELEATFAGMKVEAAAAGEALLQARREWQSERAALAAQVEQHRQRLQQKDAELASARERFAAETTHLPSDDLTPIEPIEVAAAEEAAELKLETDSVELDPRDEELSAETAAVMPAIDLQKTSDSDIFAFAVEQRNERTSSDDVAVAEEDRETDEPIAWEDLEAEPPAAPPIDESTEPESPPTSQPGAPAEVPIVVPRSRGSTPPRTANEELSAFLGDRLVEIEGQRRRRVAYWWILGGLGIAGILVVVVVLAILFGKPT